MSRSRTWTVFGSIALLVVGLALLSSHFAPQITAPKQANSPSIPYQIVRSKRVSWAYAVVAQPLNHQELIDLAFALHDRFPDTRFEIVDDTSGIEAADKAVDDPTSDLPLDWEQLHDFATLGPFFKEGESKWRLATSRATESMYGDFIVNDLSDRTSVQPRLAARADTAVHASSERIERLTDFENSAFCRQFHCKAHGSYSLKNGDSNHPYDTSLPEVTVEAETDANAGVTDMGLDFEERAQLGAKDWDAIGIFVRSLNEAANHARTISFLRDNVEIRVCSTCRVPDSTHYIIDGEYRATAGKVGGGHIVSLIRRR